MPTAKQTFLCAIPCAYLLCSCGGGKGVTSIDQNDGTQTVGDVTFSGRLTAPPILATTALGQTLALVGDLQSIVVKDQTPTNAETQLAFASGNNIYLMDGNGSVARPLKLGLPSEVKALRFAPSGVNLYYVLADSKLYKVAATGGSSSIIRSETTDAFDISPDGTRIAFAGTLGGAKGVYVSDIGGANPVSMMTVSSTQWIGAISWMADKRVVYDVCQSTYPNHTTYCQTVGQAAVQQTDIVAEADLPTVCEGGRLLVMRDVDYLYFYRPTPEGNWAVLDKVRHNQSLFPYLVSGFDPDYSFSSGISSLIYSGTHGNEQATDAGIADVGPIGWQPRSEIKVVGVGSKGPLSAAAVVFSNLDPIGTYLVADVATRSTMRVSLEGETYRLEGDKITYLSFTPDRSYTLKTLLPANSNYNGVLITFNTGRVGAVVFYNATRGSKPAILSSRQETIITGNLGEILNGDGQRIAFNALKVRITSKGVSVY